MQKIPRGWFDDGVVRPEARPGPSGGICSRARFCFVIVTHLSVAVLLDDLPGQKARTENHSPERATVQPQIAAPHQSTGGKVLLE